jgi:hypothetical protein
MLGSIANNYAELASFAAVDVDLRHHFGAVQVQTVGFRTIHDAEAAALLRNTFLVYNLCNVIHADRFPFLSCDGWVPYFQFHVILFRPLCSYVIGSLHGGQVLCEKHLFLGKLLLDGFVE